MTISQAYLQAKDISSNTPQMLDNVYFENGTFNEKLGYTGIGFNNQIITTGSYLDFANNGGHNPDNIVYSTVKSYFGTSKIFQFLGTNAGQFSIIDGNIVTTITNPNLDTETRYQTDYGSLMLPLLLPAQKYAAMYLEAEFEGAVLGYDTSFDIRFCQIEDYPSGKRFVTNNWALPDDSPSNVFIEIPCDNGTFDDSAIYIGIDTGKYRQTKIKKIWFE